MGQVRHGCATTPHAVRAAIQRSQASLATLSREPGINPKTVAKWRKRATVKDLKTGPKALHSTTLYSTTLSEAKEANRISEPVHQVDEVGDPRVHRAGRQPFDEMFSLGIWWIGSTMNRSGSDVQISAMYS